MPQQQKIAVYSGILIPFHDRSATIKPESGSKSLADLSLDSENLNLCLDPLLPGLIWCFTKRLIKL